MAGSWCAFLLASNIQQIHIDLNRSKQSFLQQRPKTVAMWPLLKGWGQVLLSSAFAGNLERNQTQRMADVLGQCSESFVATSLVKGRSLAVSVLDCNGVHRYKLAMRRASTARSGRRKPWWRTQASFAVPTWEREETEERSLQERSFGSNAHTQTMPLITADAYRDVP